MKVNTYFAKVQEAELAWKEIETMAPIVSTCDRSLQREFAAG